FNIEENVDDSPVNTEGLIVFPTAIPNVSYILITDLRSSYELQSDLCGLLTLIPFNNRLEFYCEGYLTKAGETITVSTCFKNRIF
ncbi:hypothetical protein BLA29_014851, partial [Euroglyphus maynei]